jgi:hypothetical protein
MINDKNVTYTFVGNVTNGYADGDIANLDTMPAGSIALLKAASNEVEEGALVDGQAYEVVNKLSDGTILRSPAFTSADLVYANANAYAQPSQQVSFLGYDGTTINGLGTITLGDSYSVQLSLSYTAGAIAQQNLMKSISAYATDTSQATVAKNLFETHYRQFGPLHEPFRAILCDRIARVTSVAAHDTATIAYLVNGSKTVTLYTKTAAASDALTASATTIDAGTVVNIPSYNGRTFTFTASVLGAGAGSHVIYIGSTSYIVADAGTAAENATAIAAAINAGTLATAVADTAGVTIIYNENTRALPPMVLSSVDNSTFALVAVTIASGDAVPVQYVVAATTAAAATYTLDEPWQGPTGYAYTGTTAATNIGESTLNAANAWGLKFTGVMEPFNPVTDKWTMVHFDVLGGAFGSFGTEYKAVKANEGHGNWRAVAALEQYAQGNETFYRTSNYPYTLNRTEAVAGTGDLGYDVITATFKKSVDFAASGVSVSSPFTLKLAFRSGLSYDGIDTPL